MALKRGVLFSNDPKTTSKKDIIENEIVKEKSISTEIVEFIKYFFRDYEMKIPRIFFGFIIAIFTAIQLVNYIDVYHKKKSEKENRIVKIKIIQTEINNLSNDIKKIKTYKTSKKNKFKMEKYLHFKIDSLAMVRENLKNQ